MFQPRLELGISPIKVRNVADWVNLLSARIYNYERESVNRPQMDTKRKTCDIRTWKKKHLFHDISCDIGKLVPSLYQCVETRIIEVFRLLPQPLPHIRFNHFVISETFATFLDPAPKCFTRHTLPTTIRKHFFMSNLCFESFYSQKTHNRTLFFRSTLKYGRHFDYWNQPLNTGMRVCYLDSHEAGLCYHLVIHIENICLPLQPFYFYLWLIYWVFFVFNWLCNFLLSSSCILTFMSSVPCSQTNSVYIVLLWGT
jgi:hypothetical protein